MRPGGTRSDNIVKEQVAFVEPITADNRLRATVRIRHLQAIDQRRLAAGRTRQLAARRRSLGGGRKPIPGLAGASGCRHPNRLLTPACRRKRGQARQVDGAAETHPGARAADYRALWLRVESSFLRLATLRRAVAPTSGAMVVTNWSLAQIAEAAMACKELKFNKHFCHAARQ
jgi:hypothetical protein